MIIRRELGLLYRLIEWAYKLSKVSSKTFLFILFDYSKLYKNKGITKLEYAEAELETKSEKFRNAFLGLNEQRFYLELLNPVKYYTLARNKFFAHKMLENTGVRMSELYCYYQPEGNVLESNDIGNGVHSIVEILKNKKVKQCVIKSTETSHGENVTVVKHIEYLQNDCILHFFNGEKHHINSILSKYPLIFESLISQTQQVAAFNASSINTVRFMTTLYPDGEAKIVATFMKIGRQGKCVDNAGDGGNVDACIDIETGKICSVLRYDGWRKMTTITHHPDNGNSIAGVVLNHWEDIKKQVIAYQKSFPYIKAAGWDIAITDDGPLVIEVNDMWDRIGQCFIQRGWREEIRNCYFAWQKAGVRYDVERSVKGLSDRHLKKIIYN